MKQMLVDSLTKCWKWFAATLGGIVLLAGVYFMGRSKRKGDVDSAVALHELDQVNRAAAEAAAKASELKQKQTKLVGDLLIEQMRRAEEAKRTRGLTDEQVLEELRTRGDIDPSDSK